jgi:aryl-alcohol dehydrogenase-like predicted oxidoreductase
LDIVPLIGARRREQLTEALAATTLTLTTSDLQAIEHAIPKDSASGPRDAPQIMTHLDSER